MRKEKKATESKKRAKTKQVKSDSKGTLLITVEIKNHNDKNGGHPHIIVDNIDDKHVSVGLTHDKKKGKNHPNYPLQKNPLNENKPSYMRRQDTVAPKKKYTGSRTGEMTSKDYTQAKAYGEKAKEKYIEKKHKKK